MRISFALAGLAALTASVSLSACAVMPLATSVAASALTDEVKQAVRDNGGGGIVEMNAQLSAEVTAELAAKLAARAPGYDAARLSGAAAATVAGALANGSAATAIPEDELKLAATATDSRIPDRMCSDIGYSVTHAGGSAIGGTLLLCYDAGRGQWEPNRQAQAWGGIRGRLQPRDAIARGTAAPSPEAAPLANPL